VVWRLSASRPKPMDRRARRLDNWLVVTTYPPPEIEAWAKALNSLHRDQVHDGDARTAELAAADLWADAGYPDAPGHVVMMLIRAIEIGYGAALRAVRDGTHDDDLRTWGRPTGRPDLRRR